ncbi:MAG: hypothetical protein K8T90_17710 [Planctomycetes bacterium]|nr:hypothetical protein [Planctomycetota bacterium]
MNRRALALLLTLAACGQDDPAAPTTAGHTTGVGERPTAQRPRAKPTVLVAGHALVADAPDGWTPSADDLALAARLGGTSTPEEREAAWDEIQEIEDDARTLGVIRAGLRLSDATASRTIANLAASGTYGPMLDLWEQRRASALLVEAIVDPTFLLPGGDPPGENDLFEIGGGPDLTALVTGLAKSPPPEGRVYGMSDLHKLIGKGHLPQLGALVASPDDVTAAEAWELVDLGMMMTDDDADACADAIRTHLSRGEPVALPSPSADPVGAVRVVMEQRERLKATPPRINGTAFWAWRVLGRTSAAQAAGHEADLQAIVDAYEPDAQPWGDIALRLLLAQPGSSTDDVIRRLVEDGQGDRPALLAALAKRGDADAAKTLFARCHEAEVLTEAFAVLPDATVAAVGDALLAEDEDHASAVLHAVDEADGMSPAATWDRSILAPIAHRAAASKLPPHRLARIALELPFARTLDLGRAILDRVNPAVPPTWEDDDATYTFLETVDADALRGLLRAWWEVSADNANAFVTPLLRLGDATCGARLAEWVRSGDAGDMDDVPYWLARSDGPEVRDVLGSLARDSASSQPEVQATAIAALAVCQGLPEDAARSLSRELQLENVSESLRRAVRDAVFAGRVTDAVALVLDHAPYEQFDDVHLVGDHPPIRAYLSGLRKRRDIGLYAWATAELALLGDAAARAETEAALSDMRYRWLEQLSWRQIAMGDPVAVAPVWIEGLAGNCCSEADIVGTFFDGAFGWEPRWGQLGSPSVLPVDEARAWWARAGGRFVTSRIAGHLVPAPR